MLHSVTAKQVAIVCFDQDLKNADLLNSLGHPAPRVVCYQVTLDPARLSPEGEFIRFGMGNDELGQGDEITGWIALADLTVEEILAEWDGTQFRVFEPSAQRAAA
jgi:hypothetical protein